MRNLGLVSLTAYALPAGLDKHIIGVAAVDVDEDIVFIASECVTGDDVDIRVWTLKGRHETQLRLFADVVSSAVHDTSVQVVSLTVLEETRTICLVTRSGDIAILPLGQDAKIDPNVGSLERLDIVGRISPGTTLAAAVAPDSTLTTLITAVPCPASASSCASQATLILHLLSSTFIPITSFPLSTSHGGEAVPVALGWGSKASQFHGSLGKKAALTSSQQGCTTTPDDDGLPRVSWRGDAQFFAVSSVEGVVPGKRVLRVFNRAAVLQNTAEDVPGLEHTLAWRPSGGLIAGTQRFGAMPGGGIMKTSDSPSASREPHAIEDQLCTWSLGHGSSGRHDVVFFERNGLRHGEFGLRDKGSHAAPHAQSSQSDISSTIKPTAATAGRTPTRPLLWGYRVRELAWNADSSVLSVWVERDEGDVVQLWTTSNYHWYLKLELPAPRPAPSSMHVPENGQGSGRFTGLMWHPEDASRLFLYTHHVVLDTRCVVSIVCSPRDSGLVGVVDGGDLLLTPFRVQNVPPPMASYRLPLAAYAMAVQAQCPPVHLAFAPHPHTHGDVSSPCDAASHENSAPADPHDVLAAVFPSGDVVVCTVRTALGYAIEGQPDTVTRGKRDVLTHRLIWAGRVQGGPATQVCVCVSEQEWVVAVLVQGEAKVDVLSILILVPEEPLATISEASSGHQLTVAWAGEVCLPGRGGRLIESHGWVNLRHGRSIGKNEGHRVVWQSHDGGLWEVPLGRKESQHSGQPQASRLVARFEKFCPSALRVGVSVCRSEMGTMSHSLFVGLSGSTLFITIGPSVSMGPSPAPESTLLPSITLSQACTSFAVAGSYLVWTTTAPAHEAVFARLEVLCDRLLDDQPATLQDTFEKRRVERGSRIVVAVPSSMSLVLQMPRGNLETIMPRPLVMERVRIDIGRRNYRAAFLACRKHRLDLNVIVELNPVAFEESIPGFVEQLDDVDHINLFLSGLGRSSLPPETINELCDRMREELQRRDVKKFVNSILTAHVVKTPPDYEAGLSLLLRLRATDSSLVQDAVKYLIFLVDVDQLFEAALGMYDFSLVLIVAQYSQKDPREYLPFLQSLRAIKGPYQHFKIDDHLKRYAKALRGLYQAGREYFEEAKSYVEEHGLYADALELWKEQREDYDALLELYGDHLHERREFREAALAFVRSSRINKAMIAYERGLEWQELFSLVNQEGFTSEQLSDVAYRIADSLRSKRRHAEAARVLLDYADDADEAIASLVSGSEWSEARRIAALRKREDLVVSVIIPGTLEARSSISEEIAGIRDLLDKQIGRLDELAKKRLEPETFFGLEDANLTNVDVMTDVSNPGTMFTRYTVAPTSSERSRRTSRSKRKLDRKVGRKGTVEEEEYLLHSLTKLVTRLEVVQADCRALLPHLFMLSDGYKNEARDLQSEVEALELAMRTSIDRIWMERGADSDLTRTKATEKVPRPVISGIPWKIGWIELGPEEDARTYS